MVTKTQTLTLCLLNKKNGSKENEKIENKKNRVFFLLLDRIENERKENKKKIIFFFLFGWKSKRKEN